MIQGSWSLWVPTCIAQLGSREYKEIAVRNFEKFVLESTCSRNQLTKRIPDPSLWPQTLNVKAST